MKTEKKARSAFYHCFFVVHIFGKSVGNLLCKYSKLVIFFFEARNIYFILFYSSGSETEYKLKKAFYEMNICCAVQKTILVEYL